MYQVISGDSSERLQAAFINPNVNPRYLNQLEIPHGKQIYLIVIEILDGEVKDRFWLGPTRRKANIFLVLRFRHLRLVAVRSGASD